VTSAGASNARLTDTFTASWKPRQTRGRFSRRVDKHRSVCGLLRQYPKGTDMAFTVQNTPLWLPLGATIDHRNFGMAESQRTPV
jgi:hypothetical protein